MVLYGIMSSVLIRAVLSRREVCEQQNVHVSGCEWVSNWLKWRFQPSEYQDYASQRDTPTAHLQ